MAGTYIDLVKDMYDGVLTSVRKIGGDIELFPVKVGLYQGPALSSFLFASVLNELTKKVQGEVPRCMLFADDIVLIDESRSGLNETLEM